MIVPASAELNGVVRSWHSSEEYTECRDSAGLIGDYENELDNKSPTVTSSGGGALSYWLVGLLFV